MTRLRYGARDPGLLGSALFHPQISYYADLVEEAAALWESISQNHPFLDGNKRTAFAAAYKFLAMNGARMTSDAQNTADFVPRLYEERRFAFDQLVPWPRNHVIFDK